VQAAENAGRTQKTQQAEAAVKRNGRERERKVFAENPSERQKTPKICKIPPGRAQWYRNSAVTTVQ